MLMFNTTLHPSLASIVMKCLTLVSWGRGKAIYLDRLSCLGEHHLWANSYSQRHASVYWYIMSINVYIFNKLAV